jgi:hypothetical protein
LWEGTASLRLPVDMALLTPPPPFPPPENV